jgi:hypothetical protein
MLNMMKAGVVALALTGFAVAGAAPAEAATYHTPGLTVHIGPSHAYGSPWWWQHHPRHKHKVKVCTVTWHHHHKVKVCEWKWKPWKY